MDAIDSLIHPLDRETFVREHWNRRSLYLPGDRAKLDALDLGFDLSALKRAAVELRGDPLAAIAQFFDAGGVHRQLHVTGEQIDELLAAGMSVYVPDVGRVNPTLATLAARIRAEVGYLGRVEIYAYASPPSGGFGIHFDRTNVLTVQLRGEKTWRHGDEPAVRFPRSNYVRGHVHFDHEYQARWPNADISVPSEASLRTVTLRPGDVLFLPGGTWHQTAASNGSLSIGITFVPVGAIDAVAAALVRLLENHVDWRSDLPLCPDGDIEPLRTLAGDRLRALRAVLAQTSDEELARCVADLRGPAPSAAPTATLAPADRLQASGPITYSLATDPDDGAAMVEVSAGASCVLIDRDALPFVLKLAEADVFRADDAVAWGGPAFAWGEASGVLQALVDSGLLRVLPATQVDA